MQIRSLIRSSIFALLMCGSVGVRSAVAEESRGLQPEHQVAEVATILAKLYPDHTLPSNLVQCEEPRLSTQFGSESTAILVSLKHDATLKIVRIELVESLLPNALAIEADGAPATIRVSSALMKQLPDEAALAFILAHEMYHLQSGKVPTALDGILLSPSQLGRIAETHQRWEAEADAEAARVVQAAGYSISSARTMLAVLQGSDKSGNALFRSHPPIDFRLQALARLRATTS